ncbi:MAG: hypothetical protein J7K88_13165 [Candidatus Fermentibacteraceae bacterium]|nr:hypothetical protein [Candidatus Fermentibacteraceae bacterium]
MNGKAPANDFLKKWERSSVMDFKKIIAGLKKLCSNREIIKTHRFVDCIGYPGLIELKAIGRNARLFCFVHNPGTGKEELVICTGGFWKTNDKKNTIQKQNDAMKEAFKLMNVFLESWEEV